MSTLLQKDYIPNPGISSPSTYQQARHYFFYKQELHLEVSEANHRFLPSGFYRMCLRNHNRFGAIRVFVNFGVIYEGFEEMKMETEEGEIVLNNTLAGIEVFKSVRDFVLHFVWHAPINLTPQTSFHAPIG